MNHDICRMNLPVVICIDRASIVGEDGDSHQGIFDIAFLSHLPNLIIAQGKDSKEIENLLDLAYKINSPFAVRYPRGSVLYEKFEKEEINVGKWERIINNDNRRATIITYGMMYVLTALRTADHIVDIPLVRASKNGFICSS